MIEGTVSTLSMVCMGFSAIVSFALPAALYLLFRKRFGASGKAFWTGTAVFVLFALVLESAMHRAVLGSEAGERIQNNLWLYAVYGGLAAGIFEETGRFLAMRFLLKKEQSNDGNALMYGAGHGGAEAALLLGLTMISNLALSVMINTGSLEGILKSVPAEAIDPLKTQLGALVETPPTDFLLGIIERLLAVTFHLALSVLVWFAAVKKGSIWLCPLSILLHALMDAATVIVSKHASIPVTEGVVAVITLLTVLIARAAWKKHKEL